MFLYFRYGYILFIITHLLYVLLLLLLLLLILMMSNIDISCLINAKTFVHQICVVTLVGSICKYVCIKH